MVLVELVWVDLYSPINIKVFVPRKMCRQGQQEFIGLFLKSSKRESAKYALHKYSVTRNLGVSLLTNAFLEPFNYSNYYFFSYCRKLVGSEKAS